MFMINNKGISVFLNLRNDRVVGLHIFCYLTFDQSCKKRTPHFFRTAHGLLKIINKNNSRNKLLFLILTNVTTNIRLIKHEHGNQNIFRMIKHHHIIMLGKIFHMHTAKLCPVNTFLMYNFDTTLLLHLLDLLEIHRRKNTLNIAMHCNITY